MKPARCFSPSPAGGGPGWGLERRHLAGTKAQASQAPTPTLPQRGRGQRRQQGFTLLELLVVVAIIALATAGVGLALRDSGDTDLQREGDRLAVLLESARAQSRASGVAVRWRADAQGFRFEGLPTLQLPSRWLNIGTAASGPAELWLGPEPLIGAQQVVLVSQARPGRAVRVATDGLRPFAVQALP